MVEEKATHNNRQTHLTITHVTNDRVYSNMEHINAKLSNAVLPTKKQKIYFNTLDGMIQSE